MENKEYEKFENSIKSIRAKVVEIKGLVEGVSYVKKNTKAPIAKTNNVISISNINEKE